MLIFLKISLNRITDRKVQIIIMNTLKDKSRVALLNIIKKSIILNEMIHNIKEKLDFIYFLPETV